MNPYESLRLVKVTFRIEAIRKLGQLFAAAMVAE
jgi:hypothetical protein